MPTGRKVARPLCLHAWMDADVCPKNVTNTRPGLMHVCDQHTGHLTRCQCQCGATTKPEYQKEHRP